MLKRLDFILNILMGSFIGVFLGCWAYTFWDYKTHPDLYAMWSAPWYTNVQIYGMLTAVLLAVALIIKLAIRKKME